MPQHDLTPEHIATLLHLSEDVENDWDELDEKTGTDWSQQTDTLSDRPAHKAMVSYIKQMPRPAIVELIAVWLLHEGVYQDIGKCRDEATAFDIGGFIDAQPLVEMFEVMCAARMAA